jgi:CubicO group peptidase (beta-lactamase class C family)
LLRLGQLTGIDKIVRQRDPATASVLIVRNGYVVLESYYRKGPDELQDVFSVTKSITSILVGIALQKGEIQGIDSSVLSYFHKIKAGERSALWGDITIRHLLTMTSGIGGQIGYGIGLTELQDIVNTPLQNKPGEAFAYNGVNSNLLSMILTERTGLQASEYAKKYLFIPLGIAKYDWLQQEGYTNGADDLRLTTRDMAKIGYLYLKNGVWDGNSLVSKDWVTESTRRQVSTGDLYRDQSWGYGYQWHVLSVGGHGTFIALGFSSQVICVVPDLRMVVVLTGDRETKGDRFDLIADIIVPAVASNN